MVTSVAGSPTGAGLRMNLLTMEKMVAFAAMPSPMERTMTKTRPGAARDAAKGIGEVAPERVGGWTPNLRARPCA